MNKKVLQKQTRNTFLIIKFIFTFVNIIDTIVNLCYTLIGGDNNVYKLCKALGTACRKENF